MRSRLAGLALSLSSVSAIACGGRIDDGGTCTSAPCGPDRGGPAPLPTPRAPSAPPQAPAPPPDEPAPSAPPALPISECVVPYHGETDDGRCVWSCSEGTEPDPNGTRPTADECVCQPGLQEVGTDRFGRRICR